MCLSNLEFHKVNFGFKLRLAERALLTYEEASKNRPYP